jgi:hypothetical protein
MKQKKIIYKPLRENYFEHGFMLSQQINGGTFLYQKKVLIPVLEVETIVRERSRDQLGAIENTILKLLQQSINSSQQITEFLGFSSEKKIIPIIEELRGQGLCDYINANYYITELGEKSIEVGSAMIEAERSFLLCGVSGRLLNQVFYRVERIEPKDLRYKVWGKVPIEEAQTIPLEALDIASLSNKKEYNIPDEVLEVTKLIRAKPCFVEGSLSIKRIGFEDILDLSIHGETIDWLTRKQVLPFIEPIGWEKNLSKETIIDNVKAEFIKIGFIDITVSIGLFEEVNVNFKNASFEALSTLFEGTPLLGYIGASDIVSIPINQFPFIRKEIKPVELLNGHLMHITTNNIDIIDKVKIYRHIVGGIKDFYALAYEDRFGLKLEKYVIDKALSEGILEDELIKIIEQYGNNYFKKTFLKNNDDFKS